MSKYERLLHEINLLKSRQRLFASDLAKECSVSRRTIYRDILSLSSAGIPVYFDDEYKILSDAFLPSLNFTTDEYTVLRLALTSSFFEESPFSKLAKSALAKIEGNLSSQIKSAERKKSDELKIYLAPQKTYSPNPLFFNLIRRAISTSVMLRLKYKPKSFKKTICEDIKPYSLVFLSGSWRLLGYCDFHQKYHLFDLWGIKQIMLTDRNFERQKDFNLDEVLKKLGIDQEICQPFDAFEFDELSGKSFNVKIEFSKSAKKYLESKKHHPIEKVWLTKSGDIIYTAKVNGLDDVLRWVLGFGDKAKVLEPPELREKVKKTITKVKSIYS